MFNSGVKNIDLSKIKRRIRAANYLTVAQLFLKNNFLLNDPLKKEDVKPRLLGHWGTCPGINVVYANLHARYGDDDNYSFILGPGHGFPALQANLFIDGDLAKVDKYATRTKEGIAHLCQNFSWPGENGYPSHASPKTPGVITEGGELGYALAAAYGASLGHPEKFTAVLIGDGELETATALASLNLPKLLNTKHNGKVLPILHLNGYKISGPTISGRKSERELNEFFRGFGFTPITISSQDPADFQAALSKAEDIFKSNPMKPPFLIFKSPKGLTGPTFIKKVKIAGNYAAHQIPLKDAKIDPTQLMILQKWLESYEFQDLFDEKKGFTI